MVNTRSTVRDGQGVNDGEETITPSSDETVERNEPNDEFVQASGISLPLMQFQQYWEKERAALVEQLQVEWSASLGDLREAMQEDWRSFLAEFQKVLITQAANSSSQTPISIRQVQPVEQRDNGENCEVMGSDVVVRRSPSDKPFTRASDKQRHGRQIICWRCSAPGHVAWRCPPVSAVVQMQKPGTLSQPSTSQATGWFPKQCALPDQVSSVGNARRSE
ncbi:hypothetical protein GE061_018216 [Apolygus lucorum]|uniref:CCHC-type domain-containing protein n=1 Tax=Apolygus lucorum TaxID=248454 RepID=A0A8S9XEK7_APOLU|nr:hypothetical protein GE061_018216 [Apolygus lucorum]